ncbi:hypothetical protein GEMRC1_002081 [Eukaryota sp. GEM-RC1]
MSPVSLPEVVHGPEYTLYPCGSSSHNHGDTIFPPPLKKSHLSSVDDIPLYCLIDFKTVITDSERLTPLLFNVKKKSLPKCTTTESSTEIVSEEQEAAEVPTISEEIEVSRPELVPNAEDDQIILIVLTFIYTNFVSTVVISTKKTSDFDGVQTITFPSEEVMINGLISLLSEKKPRLLISYNSEKFLFPFLIARCKLWNISTTFNVDRPFRPFIPIWFYRWCKQSEFGPFISLNMTNVVKSTYVFKGGRGLENVCSKLFQKAIPNLFLSPTEFKPYFQPIQKNPKNING